MADKQIERRVWQCPLCEKEYRIPATAKAPASCPKCKKAANQKPATIDTPDTASIGASTSRETSVVIPRPLEDAEDSVEIDCPTCNSRMTVLREHVDSLGVHCPDCDTVVRVSFAESPYVVVDALPDPVISTRQPSRRILTTVVLVAIGLPVLGGILYAINAKRNDAVSGDGSALFERISPAVVQIEVRGWLGKPLSQGTGFFVDGKGTIVTNAHVLSAPFASFATVETIDDVTLFVEDVEAVDLKHDLAILKVSLPTNSWGELSEERPKVGTRVLAIGNPQGLRHSLSEGVISGIRDEADSPTMLQTTAAISPGSSGGPLLTSDGKVVGVTTANLADGQNLNFAIPVSAIHSLLKQKHAPQKLSKLAAKVNPPAEMPKFKAVFADERQTLAGLPGVFVLVESVPPALEAIGLSTDSIRTVAELKLRSAGVRVLSKTESYANERFPVLYVQAGGFSNELFLVWSVNVEFTQNLSSTVFNRPGKGAMFNSSQFSARTWRVPGSIGSGPVRNVSGARKAMIDKIERDVNSFANDFLAANPQP